MKNSRFNYQYRQSASKLHVAVGECLRQSAIFSGYQIFQEYPVIRVNPTYSDSSHHFDWTLPDICLVIECMGAQHFHPVLFGGEIEQALFSFQDGKRRDRSKKDAAIQAGYSYIEIPYWDQDKITEQYIWDLYQSNKNIELVDLPKTRHEEQLEKARQYRKQQYNKLKNKGS